MSIQLGTEGTLPATDAPVALSPDGTVLAFVARPSGGAPHLYVRRLDQLSATLLDGTDEAETPCFSPDGQWIAFFAGGKLEEGARSWRPRRDPRGRARSRAGPGGPRTARSSTRRTSAGR